MARRSDRIPSWLSQLLADAAEGKVPWPLYLSGGAGVGKTCAALCLCDLVEDSHYRTHRQLATEVQRAQAGTLCGNDSGRSFRVWPEEVWDRIRRAPLAVIDEIGMREKASDFSYEVLYDWLEARRGLPAVVIANHPVSAITAVYDERITSRLLAGTAVHSMTPDLRARGSS